MAVARPMSACSLPPSAEDAAPDDGAGLADALERSSAEAEVHGRLALAAGAGVAAGDVRCGDGAGDLEDPDEVVDL